MNGPDRTGAAVVDAPHPQVAPGTAWADTNERLLAAELAQVKAWLRRAGTTLAPQAAEAHDKAGRSDQAAEEQLITALQASVVSARAALQASGATAALDDVAMLFGLSSFERSLLLLTAGVELDADFAPLCGQAAAASGGAAWPYATLALALAALPGAHWSALTPGAPLRRWRLLEVAEATGQASPLMSARLRIDERVLHHLAGINETDARLRPMLRLQPAVGLMAASQGAAAQATADELLHQSTGAPWPVLQLWGSDPAGQRDVAAAIAANLGLSLFVIDAAAIPADPRECEALATLWTREAALQRAALLVDCDDLAAPAMTSPAATSTAAAARLADSVAGLVLLARRDPIKLARPDLHLQIDKPDRADQLTLWQQAMGADAAARLGTDLEAAASAFRLSAADIRNSAAQVARSGAGDGVLWQACRSHNRLKLDGLAQRIEAQAGWDDLVLPEPHKQLLRQMAAQVRHQLTVCERWGFAGKSARGLGISALFAGESGTGKTMAAEVLAHELHLELFRIDLSAVVSKYIGETEKNLARVFEAAEDNGAILLFDEADALFGKRSEVRDSHDRYANIEVSYLLQRMEAYRGLAILTTNQKAALDSAFQRRLRFVVNFTFPDVAEREAIWHSVFPAVAPLAGIDCAKLARLSVAGGSIRNIALNAAFQAAQAGTAISMVHVLRAAHIEAAKRDRAITDAETRGWV